MKEHHRGVLKNTLLIVISMFIVSLVLLFVPVNSSESGPLEIGQNIVLFIAMLSWGTLYFQPNTPRELRNFHRIFAAFFTVLVFVVLGRELSWLEVTGVEDSIADTIELVAALFALSLLLAMLFVWLVSIKNKKAEFVLFWQSNTAIYAVVSFVFILGGDFFEKDFFDMPNHQLFEEVSELTGHIFILVAALTELMHIKSKR